MSRLMRSINRPFAASTSAGDLALFTTLFCSAFFIRLSLNFYDQFDFLMRHAKFQVYSDQLRRYPQREELFGLVDVPSLEPMAFLVVGAILLAALLCAALGYRTRAAIIVALGCYFLYFGQILELDYVRRKTNPLPFILLILAFAPGLGRLRPVETIRRIWSERHDSRSSLPTTPSWPLALVKLFLASVYLATAIAKLSNTGLSWASGSVLQANLVEHSLSYDLMLGMQLAQQPLLCALLSTGTLVFEGFFWVVLLLPRFGGWFAVAGICFHYGVTATMGIPYFTYFGLAYWIFLDVHLVKTLSQFRLRLPR